MTSRGVWCHFARPSGFLHWIGVAHVHERVSRCACYMYVCMRVRVRVPRDSFALRVHARSFNSVGSASFLCRPIAYPRACV